MPSQEENSGSVPPPLAMASVARGRPTETRKSFNKTSSVVEDFKEEDYWNELRLPDEGFTFWTVEELIRTAIQEPCSS